MALLYCVTSLYLWQGNPVFRGGGTMAHLFLVHTGTLTSEKTVEHLPSAAKYKENRKLWENVPLFEFPTISYTKLTPIPHFTQSSRRSELSYCYAHTFLSWSTKKHARSFWQTNLNKQIKRADWHAFAWKAKGSSITNLYSDLAELG